MGDSEESLFRPKGIGLDSENHIYLVEGLSGTVQVFDREGQLLYFFGRRGKGLGEFQLPAGLFIDQNDRVYVVDSYNRRVQVFQYQAVKVTAQGVKP
jgi:DNA-binding beta-propeller fold protein YncE